MECNPRAEYALEQLQFALYGLINTLSDTEREVKQVYVNLQGWRGNSGEKAKEDLKDAYLKLTNKTADVENMKTIVGARQIRAGFPGLFDPWD